MGIEERIERIEERHCKLPKSPLQKLVENNGGIN